ncbi:MULTISPECIES: hypothetical protein [unclassified Janthinobacterium]|uniref:hypothetical protein n=1 Tax=unclassified Janthinobacterium TaxID=2610881 RepID=UPI0012F94042|nr:MULTISPECIES: hypothetical protein [unclassified Janthinobacterium]MEC5162578.1 hypothetical protein [Janthinobacterium sp. CG_S6]
MIFIEKAFINGRQRPGLDGSRVRLLDIAELEQWLQLGNEALSPEDRSNAIRILNSNEVYICHLDAQNTFGIFIRNKRVLVSPAPQSGSASNHAPYNANCASAAASWPNYAPYNSNSASAAASSSSSQIGQSSQRSEFNFNSVVHHGSNGASYAAQAWEQGIARSSLAGLGNVHSIPGASAFVMRPAIRPSGAGRARLISAGIQIGAGVANKYFNGR